MSRFQYWNHDVKNDRKCQIPNSIGILLNPPRCSIIWLFLLVLDTALDRGCSRALGLQNEAIEIGRRFRSTQRKEQTRARERRVLFRTIKASGAPGPGAGGARMEGERVEGCHLTMWIEFPELRNAILHLVHLFKSATFSYTQVQIVKGKIKYWPEPALSLVPG